ncbi:MAG: malate:quinone oxidoreductase [Bacteroidetes bacterium]|nr:malate:quinone oxidoreductase [Bacteroidota bacterium]
MSHLSHVFHAHHQAVSKPDVVLIGTGIMSATLGFFLKELQPNLVIEIYERLDSIAAESSDAWNNAGTGHSAFCELNYTPQKEDGSIDISKALKITEQFELSKQLWAYLIEKKYIDNPKTFIHSVPHHSFVWGKENAAYLKKRFESLSKHHFYEGMVFSEEHETLKKWFPLIMKNRSNEEVLAATKMALGTDMNFGELTRHLFKHLLAQEGVRLFLNHEIVFLEKKEHGGWEFEAKNIQTHEKKTHETPFIFIGAGGGALPLLEKAEIPEGKGFGGFPVSGQWLVCKNETVIQQHAAKVYGKAEVGAPPMSVPHLDTRIIDGKKALLFGPYAGFSTKFLKHGSLMDLPASLQVDNLVPIMSAGLHNIPLTKYLIEQVRQSPEERLAALQKFVPTARIEDWTLEEAGQRVQIIKKDEKVGGVLEFGTEVVAAADGSLSALLGASPGASTSVHIMLELLKKCFKENMQHPEWQNKLKEMIPSYGVSLAENKELCNTVRARTSRILELEH